MRVIGPAKGSSDSGIAGKMLVGAGIGLVIFIGLNLLFAAAWAPDLSSDSLREHGWSQSRNTVICTLATLFVATVLVLYRSRSPVRQATALWIGVEVGVVWMMVITYQPDELWPFDLIFASCVTASQPYSGCWPLEVFTIFVNS